GLWGIFFILVSVGVQNTSWISFVFLLEVVSVLVLFFYAQKEKPDEISKAPGRIMGFGIANAIGLGAYGLAVSTIPTTIAAPIVSALPVVTLILAHIVLRERLGPIQYFGVAIIIGGVVVLSL
ncbi:EamA family transporter, partial [Candidatus Micrarchaeota archaeon]|nr:EamA family transporter [Candidatus Micrarchaeota archaeon]